MQNSGYWKIKAKDCPLTGLLHQFLNSEFAKMTSPVVKTQGLHVLSQLLRSCHNCLFLEFCTSAGCNAMQNCLFYQQAQVFFLFVFFRVLAQTASHWKVNELSHISPFCCTVFSRFCHCYTCTHRHMYVSHSWLPLSFEFVPVPLPFSLMLVLCRVSSWGHPETAGILQAYRSKWTLLSCTAQAPIKQLSWDWK